MEQAQPSVPALLRIKQVCMDERFGLSMVQCHVEESSGELEKSAF